MADWIYSILKQIWRFFRNCVKFLAVLRILHGYLVFLRIRTKFPLAVVFVYDYTGIGDVYVFCTLIKANYQRINGGNFIIAVTTKTLGKIINIFELKNYVIIGKEAAKSITVFSLAAPSRTVIQNITPFPQYNHTDISFRFGGIFLNMSEIYKYQMFGLGEEASFQYPKFIPNYQGIERLFLQKDLVQGKTAILSPYAKTCLCYSDNFWQELAAELKKRGFTVCTNASGQEETIKETIPLFFAFNDAEEILKRAGLFIALRSGLCDVVCNADCKKIILYPDYRMFNSSMYDFCSFEKMEMGRNITEIQCSLNDEEKLLRKILEKLDEK